MSTDNEDYDSEADVEPTADESTPYIKLSRKAFEGVQSSVSAIFNRAPHIRERQF